MNQRGHRAQRPGRVTIKDVAREAGVSPSTVSHAFSGRRAISGETKERVFAAASRLGYSADPHARSMRTGRSEMIGLVLRPRFAATGAPESSETFNRLAGSAATECLRRGIGLVHVPDPTRDNHAAVPMDGCIIAHPYASDPMIDLLSGRGVPIVCADPDPDRPDLPWTVGVDYAAGMREVFDALDAGPGERVWLLPGSEENAWNREARRVYAQWCRERGAPPEVHVLSESLSPEETEGAVSRLIAEHGAPAALVYSLSKSTPAVLRALSAAGLSTPDGIRLATLTDSSFSRAAQPPITALDLNHEGLASAAVALLIAQISGAEPPRPPGSVAPALNLRASTRRR
ncbi:LacI family DNA-binding transcriptional regulator [Nocardiopsis coralliicola]